MDTAVSVKKCALQPQSKWTSVLQCCDMPWVRLKTHRTNVGRVVSEGLYINVEDMFDLFWIFAMSVFADFHLVGLEVAYQAYK